MQPKVLKKTIPKSPMSLEQRKALDEAMRGNPLWELHRRRMLEVDSALGDWRFEDLRDEVRDFLIDSIEGRNTTAPSVVHMEVPDTDAKTLYHQKEEKPLDDSTE